MHKRNIRMDIAYDGTRYLGWQRLGGEKINQSIQGLLELCISDVVKENIKIQGSGRTDAGVHAYAQVANFFTTSSKECKDILEECNGKLPEDIVIIKMEEVNERFHSRYSAVSKIYEYYIDTGEREDVFLRKYVYHFDKRLDIEIMKEAASYLIGEHDFTTFSTERCKEKSNGFINNTGKNNELTKDMIRTLYDIDIQVVPGLFTISDQGEHNLIRIQIHGNGFLYNMVRIIVGSLLVVGTGEKKPIDIKHAIEKQDRQYAGPTAPSNGLFLKKVVY